MVAAKKAAASPAKAAKVPKEPKATTVKKAPAAKKVAVPKAEKVTKEKKAPAAAEKKTIVCFYNSLYSQHLHHYRQHWINNTSIHPFLRVHNLPQPIIIICPISTLLKLPISSLMFMIPAFLYESPFSSPLIITSYHQSPTLVIITPPHPPFQQLIITPIFRQSQLQRLSRRLRLKKRRKRSQRKKRLPRKRRLQLLKRRLLLLPPRRLLNQRLKRSPRKRRHQLLKRRPLPRRLLQYVFEK
jgi:hypothetical protein